MTDNKEMASPYHKYQREATFLAVTYPKMLKDKSLLLSRLSGDWTYTKAMAITDLMNISVDYEGDRVQTSLSSSSTERIALKLTDEYMAQKQDALNAEREACYKELRYISWKIEVVETVFNERASEIERDVFQLLFIARKSYREAARILLRKRNIKISHRTLAAIKEELGEMFTMEIELRQLNPGELDYIERLTNETKEFDHEAKSK